MYQSARIWLAAPFAFQASCVYLPDQGDDMGHTTNDPTCTAKNFKLSPESHAISRLSFLQKDLSLFGFPVECGHEKGNIGAKTSVI